jgi:hypothetical protein
MARVSTKGATSPSELELQSVLRPLDLQAPRVCQRFQPVPVDPANPLAGELALQAHFRPLDLRASAVDLPASGVLRIGQRDTSAMDPETD